MKVAQITARGTIQLVNAPDPAAPAPGQAIVKAETGCLCGSDIPFFSDAQPSYPLGDTRKHRHIIRMGNAVRHRWIIRYFIAMHSRRTWPLRAKNPAPS